MFLIDLQRTQSSASSLIVDVTSSALSIMYIKNSVGPMTVPWCTHDVTGGVLDVAYHLLFFTVMKEVVYQSSCVVLYSIVVRIHSL